MARSVEVLDVNNPEHAGFMFDLLMACKDDFLDDYEKDIIKVINTYQYMLENGIATAFLCRVNGEKVGVIGVSNNNKDVGDLLAAMMPKHRQGLGRHAYKFLDDFVGFCFNRLGYRKLRTLNAINNQKPERLLRKYGFRKVGLHPEETVKNGQPVTMVELYMTKSLYEGLKR